MLHDAGSVENRLERHAEALPTSSAPWRSPSPAPPPTIRCRRCAAPASARRCSRWAARAALAPLERALVWREAHAGEIPAIKLGATRFALAKARWAAGDRDRAVEAARAAREAFEAHRARFAGQPGWATKAVKVAEGKLADVDRWLGSRATR